MSIKNKKTWPSAFVLASLASALLIQPVVASPKLPSACSSYKFSSEYSFAHLQAPAKTIGDVEHPMNRGILYRGIRQSNPQFTLKGSVSAMLGAPLYVGSPMHYLISSVLQQRHGLDDAFFPGSDLPHAARRYFTERQIMPDIQSLIDCNGGSAFAQPVADALAADLLDKYFSRLSDREINTTYFNMADASYYENSFQRRGFGNNAVDLIISTSHDRIAAHYGKNVLVFKDNANKALDLGLWNFVNNGRLYDSWLDNGEINSPGYIKGEDILGYQIRALERDDSGNWGSKLSVNPIDWAFQKITFEGKPYIAILDGSGALCAMENSDHRFYPCNLPNDLTKIPSQPPTPGGMNKKSRIPLAGVISLCADATHCPPVDRLFTDYGRRSNRSLPASVISEISSITVGSKTAVIQVNSVEEPVPPVSKIKITSATFGANVGGTKDNALKAASNYADGKTSIDYLVSVRHLTDPAPDKDKDFEIKYICSGQPSKEKREYIAAPSEWKKITLDCPAE